MKFHWGHGLFLFITLFVIGIVIFVVFALSHSQDLVEEDYYDQGAGYSRQIEINKHSAIYYDSINLAGTGHDVKITLCKSLANSGDSLNIYFYRPSDKKSDFRIKSPMSDVISVPSNKLKKGRYVVKMSWTHSETLFNVNKELFIQ